ncbi:MerR family transcriptional regulator [Aminipila butyrica]|uniref:MerR family transcriptional regulator n=1 Tax=Aminipila butyrica TaxID=433296 RepID=A0A858BVW5_9FIRM|nr:MerR family transcriptional regulator [Aminipila butyrica]QIB69319.1 MerR family transcriptional regulator [Aminipila butyrica]
MRIGEVAEQTGLSISNIRFYEKKGLIEPARERHNKYRDYTEEDMKRLKWIILYRKMGIPLESIYLLVKKERSIEFVIEKQIEDLFVKQESIRGSIVLCQKMIKDQDFKQMDVDYYLNYIKSEEAAGTKFDEMDELLTDFAAFTQFNWIAGTACVRSIFLKTWMNRLVLLLWGMVWLSIPANGIVGACLKMNSSSPGIILFWVIWSFFLGIAFLQFRTLNYPVKCSISCKKI